MMSGAYPSTVDSIYYPGVLEYCLQYRVSYHTLHLYEYSDVKTPFYNEEGWYQCNDEMVETEFLNS